MSHKSSVEWRRKGRSGTASAAATGILTRGAEVEDISQETMDTCRGKPKGSQVSRQWYLTLAKCKEVPQSVCIFKESFFESEENDLSCKMLKMVQWM